MMMIVYKMIFKKIAYKNRGVDVDWYTERWHDGTMVFFLIINKIKKITNYKLIQFKGTS